MSKSRIFCYGIVKIYIFFYKRTLICKKPYRDFFKNYCQGFLLYNLSVILTYPYGLRSRLSNIGTVFIFIFNGTILYLCRLKIECQYLHEPLSYFLFIAQIKVTLNLKSCSKRRASRVNKLKLINTSCGVRVEKSVHLIK